MKSLIRTCYAFVVVSVLAIPLLFVAIAFWVWIHIPDMPRLDETPRP